MLFFELSIFQFITESWKKRKWSIVNSIHIVVDRFKNSMYFKLTPQIHLLTFTNNEIRKVPLPKEEDKRKRELRKEELKKRKGVDWDDEKGPELRKERWDLEANHK